MLRTRARDVNRCGSIAGHAACTPRLWCGHPNPRCHATKAQGPYLLPRSAAAPIGRGKPRSLPLSFSAPVTPCHAIVAGSEEKLRGNPAYGKQQPPVSQPISDLRECEQAEPVHWT